MLVIYRLPKDDIIALIARQTEDIVVETRVAHSDFAGIIATPPAKATCS